MPDPQCDLSALRAELITIAHRTYRAGLAAATDGNVSARTANGTVLITASGVCLGEATSTDLLEVDANSGECLHELALGQRPTSELMMHLAVYQARPDVHAIVHAHPPITIAFSIAGESLAPCVIPEVVVGLGTIPTIPYTTPTTAETAEAVRKAIRSRDAIILEHHGSVTVAKTPTQAFHKLDKVEHTAKILLAAKQLGGIRPLPTEEVRRLLSMRESMGLPPIIPEN